MFCRVMQGDHALACNSKQSIVSIPCYRMTPSRAVKTGSKKKARSGEGNGPGYLICARQPAPLPMVVMVVVVIVIRVTS
ncbi:hypothetical protein C7R88_12965 [Plesiomonas shigelloides]|nr:hypothetical protein C7R88_12965 [Plesiomonas shigelloides]HAD42108.1 hypothetical protein [Plesiomonas shigelloides]